MNRDFKPIATVLEAASSLLLTDLDTVKDELGIAADDTTQDVRLIRYITQASAQIHAYCRRIFPIQAYRNVFRGDLYYQCCVHPTYWGEPIVLSHFPVVEILGVSENDAAVAVSDYDVEQSTGKLWHLSGGARTAWSGYPAVIDFRAGYASIPDEVEAAAILLIRLRQGLRGWNPSQPLRDPAVRSREGDTYGRIEYFGNVMPNTVDGLPPDIAQMLELYREPVFA